MNTKSIEELRKALNEADDPLVDIVRHVAIRLPMSASEGMTPVNQWNHGEQGVMDSCLRTLLYSFNHRFVEREKIRKEICALEGKPFHQSDMGHLGYI